MEPADDKDEPVFIGRFNLGVISLNLPMILAKAQQENKDFYEVLDYYMEMSRGLHKRTYEYLAEMRASTNPLMYCQGGFYGGHLKPNDKIRPILKPCTLSFGFTALNELQELYNNKSLVEDGAFALEVMEYINKKITEYKKADGLLYAIYGTPAESLCFSGDTEVQCYNGNKQIKDIKVGDLVYSYNEEQKKIELKPVIRSMMTQKDAEVVKVTFDNGQSIVCTPNHPFATRHMEQNADGTFVEENIRYVNACDLKAGMRIKSNYITLNTSGRPQCSNYYNGEKQLIQDIVAEYFLGDKASGYVLHHKDSDKGNNDKDNLEYIRDDDHKKIHLKDTIGKYSFSSENASGKNNAFYGKKHTEESKELNRQMHLNPKGIIQYDKDNNVIGVWTSLQAASRDGWSYRAVRQACRHERKAVASNFYAGSYWDYIDKEDAFALNHKVVSVEKLEQTINVYDIEVEDNHNFYVGGNEGLLVHNCGTQLRQFRAKYGIIPKVSDREYFTNSFHCHVTEDITPTEKQDLEKRFWDLANGGKIQYVRYRNEKNIKSFMTLIDRAMNMGLYEGVNMDKDYCGKCGHTGIDFKDGKCPVCGSDDVVEVNRVCGYLGYSKVHGKSRMNAAKMNEVKDRKSM